MHPFANSLRDDPDLPAALLGDDPLAAALALARLGIGVFPAHTVDAEGGLLLRHTGLPQRRQAPPDHARPPT